MSEIIRPEIMVMASGSASTLDAVVRATQSNRGEEMLDPGFDVGLVTSNNPNKTFPTVNRLNKEFGLNMQTEIVNGKIYPEGPAERGITDGESDRLKQLFEDGGFALTAMLGYMKVLRGTFLEKYGWQPGMNPYEAKIINTHPGILPETADTYGESASKRAIDLDLRHTAHTVHVVSAGVDEGPKVYQTPVSILPGDTSEVLFGRVQLAEKAVLPFAIGAFLRRQRELAA